MRPRILTAVAASVSVLIIAGAHAQGMCSKPQTPSCAIEPGRFAGEEEYDQCRLQMLKYKSSMETYAVCHDDADRRTEGQSARDELEQSLAVFNRKARGEHDR
jgi:hypothetical protein